jgi:Domain of unknown function (DUF4249)
MIRLRNIGFWIIVVALIEIAGCKKPYAPSITASNVNYLVVEGVISTGQDLTIIKLSRTVKLSGNASTSPELNAQVSVEDSKGNGFRMTELGNGQYQLPSLDFDKTENMRLRIITADGKVYLSDFVADKDTPPIDSVGFIIQSDGIQLYANTHDPNNNTRYYRWDYVEIWQFHALYQSLFITDGQKIILRTPGQQIYSCFGNNNSSSITLGSSARLQQDVIYQNPITEVPSTSEKLELKYSILVKQYALTADAFNFWQNLKKNTEQLGSIFDPQPSNLNGNIHCITTPTEPVIGYISVTNIQQKRIFIDNSQLPLAWRPSYPYQCEIDTSFFSRPPTGQNDVALFLIPIGSAQVPIAQLHPPNRPDVIGYLGASVDCVDCTIRGTTKQPIFWK